THHVRLRAFPCDTNGLRGVHGPAGRLPRLRSFGDHLLPVPQHSSAILHGLCQRYRLAATLSPMDFAAWMEVYLGGRWHTFDPRNNAPRIGRILIAYGRDAADVPLTHIFGPGELRGFQVWTDEALSSSS